VVSCIGDGPDCAGDATAYRKANVRKKNCFILRVGGWSSLLNKGTYSNVSNSTIITNRDVFRRQKYFSAASKDMLKVSAQSGQSGQGSQLTG
jgi:hypothetical protein